MEIFQLNMSLSDVLIDWHTKFRWKHNGNVIQNIIMPALTSLVCDIYLRCNLSKFVVLKHISGKNFRTENFVAV